MNIRFPLKGAAFDFDQIAMCLLFQQGNVIKGAEAA